MADTKISALTAKAAPVAADTAVIVDSVGGANKKITLGAIPIAATQIADGSVTNTEFQYIGTVTSDVQTQLNAKAALLASAPADHGYSGAYITGTAGENLVIGDVCYLKTDGKYWKAMGNAAATMPAVAMATGTINADATGVMLLSGYIRNDDGWGGALTVGSPTGRLWVSAGTAGLATQTQPAVATNLVQGIGYAVAARIVFFDPVRTLITVA